VSIVCPWLIALIASHRSSAALAYFIWEPREIVCRLRHVRVPTYTALFLLALASACGVESAAGGDRTTSLGKTDSTGDVTSTTSELTSPSGLRCPDDLFEIGSIDYASGTVGADSPIEAAAIYLGVEPDGSAFDATPKESGRVLVLYKPTSEPPTAAFTVVDYWDLGWLVETVETCAGSKESGPPAGINLP